VAEEDEVIRTATQGDAAGIASIYNHDIERTVVTFEEQPVSAEEMARRLREVEEAALP
jgi:phosphinothricin acetyltransferase